MTPDPKTCPHIWLNTSNRRAPLIGASTCSACGKTAESSDIRMWCAMNRVRAFMERQAKL